MRLYDLGLEDDDDSELVGSGVIDIKMPKDILAEMQTVDATVKQLDGEIQASTVPAVFKLAWAGFLGEWRQFFAEHESWSSRLWYAAYEKTLEYRKRLGEWRAAFVQLGGKTIAPELPSTDAAAARAVPWLIVGGLLIGGGLAAYLAHKLQRPVFVPVGRPPEEVAA